MKIILKVLFVLSLLFLAAVAHESDMARNFKKTGDAKAFFYEIKCGCNHD